METKQQPQTVWRDRVPDATPRTAQTAESNRPGVTVRVSVVDDWHDEEEKEAGYGHGV